MHKCTENVTHSEMFEITHSTEHRFSSGRGHLLFREFYMFLFVISGLTPFPPLTWTTNVRLHLRRCIVDSTTDLDKIILIEWFGTISFAYDGDISTNKYGKVVHRWADFTLNLTEFFGIFAIVNDVIAATRHSTVTDWLSDSPCHACNGVFTVYICSYEI